MKREPLTELDWLIWLRVTKAFYEGIDSSSIGRLYSGSTQQDRRDAELMLRAQSVRREAAPASYDFAVMLGYCFFGGAHGPCKTLAHLDSLAE